jgi:hypothetical protein
MRDLRFYYRGADLVAPIAAFLVRLDASIAETQAAFDALPAAAREVVRSQRVEFREPLADENKARQLVARLVELRHHRRRYDLWLFEATRTPANEWALSLDDLTALYPDPLPPQPSPGTQAASSACTKAPSPWFRWRQLLASLLARMRRPVPPSRPALPT